MEENRNLELNFTTKIEDFYEYMLTEEMKDIPFAKRKAIRSFLFEMLGTAIVGLILYFVPGVDSSVFYVVAGVAGLFVILFLLNVALPPKNAKYLTQLMNDAHKKNTNGNWELCNLKLLPDKMEYSERPGDGYNLRNKKSYSGFTGRTLPFNAISEIYETKNLVVIRPKKEKKVLAASIQRILVPKRILSAKSLPVLKKYLTEKTGKKIYDLSHLVSIEGGTVKTIPLSKEEARRGLEDLKKKN